MDAARPLLALLGLGGGVMILTLGIQKGQVLEIAGGIVLAVLGLFLSFRKVVCPSCRSAAWISSSRATHCNVCGVAYDGSDQPKAD